MVASENGALPGGKAGGVGDVLRELPRALVANQVPVTVLCPAYGRLHETAGMVVGEPLTVPFAGQSLLVQTYNLRDVHGVDHVVLQHEAFDPHGDQRIYHDDGIARPFATDASKFALLSAAAGCWLLHHATPDAVIHAHDWHAAPLLTLRAFLPEFSGLQKFRTVLTLHNLALQGIRPLRHDASSLQAWFPSIGLDNPVLRDPRYADCYNPVAAAIQLADAINTVSPNNAQEILQPDDPARAFRGGEGLQAYLQSAQADGRLVGILNGCDYDGDYSRQQWPTLATAIDGALNEWQRTDPANKALHRLAMDKLARIDAAPHPLLTSVGRLTDQKIQLLLLRDDEGISSLQHIIATLPAKALFIMLGTGDPTMEVDLVEHSRRDARFLFLRGFSESLSDLIYRTGDLFVMPSSFEPCGISQMMAMRAGQPCLVHAVGGLYDTVEEGFSGYRFAGDSLAAQTHALRDAVQRAMQDFQNDDKRWALLRRNAASLRFRWTKSASLYQQHLYQFND